MQDTKELVLIEGVFSSDEATKLLFSFIDNKINYHNLEIFSAKELSANTDVSKNVKRIQELKAARASLKDIIASARQHQQKLLVNSVIKIELIDE